MPQDVVKASDILLGRGKVYVDRLDASGVKTGERFLGNCTTFEVGVTDDVLEKFSSASSTSDLVKRVNRQRTPEVQITLDEFSKENIALAMMGDVSAFTQSGATVTDEAVATTSTKKGYYVQLGGSTPARHISSVTSVRSASGGGGTLYVAGTDYDVDLVRARLYIRPAGGIPDAGPIFVTYVKSAVTGTTRPYVQIGKSATIECFVRFVGDPASGPTKEVELWKVAFQPDGVLGLISEEFGSFALTGAVQADETNHPGDEKYGRIYDL